MPHNRFREISYAPGNTTDCHEVSCEDKKRDCNKCKIAHPAVHLLHDHLEGKLCPEKSNKADDAKGKSDWNSQKENTEKTRYP